MEECKDVVEVSELCEHEETKASQALRLLDRLKDTVGSETSAAIDEIIKLIVDNEKDIHDEIEFIIEAVRNEMKESFLT